jgi:hypothetical protein
MSEYWTAILRGLGFYPTRYLLRWNPVLKNPLRFDLVEVSKCDADGCAVGSKASQRTLALHAGHRRRDPACYSLLDVLKVQLRLIR